MLAFVAGQEDMTFSTEISPAMLQDIKSQMLSAICQMQPTNTQTNLLVNRDKPPVGTGLSSRSPSVAPCGRATGEATVNRRGFREVA
jgi:hypothetical protein